MRKADRERVDVEKKRNAALIPEKRFLPPSVEANIDRVAFLLGIIDKQEVEIKDLEEAYDDAFPYGWGGI